MSTADLFPTPIEHDDQRQVHLSYPWLATCVPEFQDVSLDTRTPWANTSPEHAFDALCHFASPYTAGQIVSSDKYLAAGRLFR